MRSGDPRRVLHRLASRSGLVLAYHDVIADSAPVYPYAVRESTFHAQLRLTRRLGFEFVPLSALADALLAGRSVAGLAAVLFDDALRGVHLRALPYLATESIPWTLLPVTDRLGVAPDWWEPADRTMTRTEVAEAVSAGAELCGHTATHPSLPALDDDAVRSELLRSREQLSEWGGREVRDMCYPFGHQDARIRRLVAESGYRTGWSFTNGRCHPADDPFALARMAMREEMQGARWAKFLLRPRWTWPAVEDQP